MFYWEEDSSDLQRILMEREMVQGQSTNLRHHLEDPHIPDKICKEDNYIIFLFFHNIKPV